MASSGGKKKKGNKGAAASAAPPTLARVDSLGGVTLTMPDSPNANGGPSCSAPANVRPQGANPFL